MTIDVNTAMALLVPGALIVIWAVRLEGRISSVDQQRASDDKLNTERFMTIQRHLEGITESLDRLPVMEAKVNQIRSFMSGGVV